MDTNAAASLFRGGGVAGALVRELDWTHTSLGSPHSWPLALLSQVRTMLATRQPMCIFWGPELVNLYNDGFLPILGEKHPAAMGQRAEECWHDAWPIVGAQLLEAKRGECVFNEKVLVPIVRGGRVDDAWFNYSYSPLFDDDGRANGVLVICTEVTSEVLARRQLEALAVQQATARKQAELLRQQAEAASRAKDDFLATVSHELRTPLNAILGWSGIVMEPGGRDRIDRALPIIERNARAQAKIIDDMLDVSRIISGKLLLSPKPVDVASVIGAAADSVRPAAIAKGVRLHVETHVQGPWIADEDRIQQVVWNLLSNAVKFTPAGGSARVRATGDTNELRILVSDTGKGIPQSFLPYVFDRFRQADASTTRVHGGLGLGLAIVRHLVELHGGVVTAQSDGEGRGSTFEIALPRRAIETFTSPAGTNAEPSQISETAPDTRPSLRGLSVLIVDDERDARELAAIVLEDAGANVVQAGDVATALRALTETRISAIVSDIGMPEEDGYSFLTRVRAETSTHAIPALALTAFARAEDRQDALSAGFQRHLAKPIDPAKLVAAIAALVRA
ncbi:MAG TPA: ATP-binding protein [Polyangiaceae bacterium]|nr:ATP-binding protein [Polyangiaceae bacterium]